MTDSMQPGPDDKPESAADPTLDDDSDTSGHSMANYEFVRQEARQRTKETGEWSRKEGLRRESRGLLDRLRGR